MSFSLAGCGYIGNSQPPAVDIPSAVINLRAAEDGDRVLVEFTIPMLTTEGLPVKSLRSVDLYAGPGPANSPNAAAWAETAKKYSGPADIARGYTFDQIPVSDWKERASFSGYIVPLSRMNSWPGSLCPPTAAGALKRFVVKQWPLRAKTGTTI